MLIKKAHGKSVGMNVYVMVMHAFSINHILYESYSLVRILSHLSVHQGIAWWGM
jgi:hypothetical protein